jgi:hypothetical protein
MPKCFQCSKTLSSVKDLCHHLRHAHLLYEPVTSRCCEGGCCRTFSHFNSFCRHLTSCHFQTVVPVDPDDDTLDDYENTSDSECGIIPTVLSPVFADVVDPCCSSATEVVDVTDIKLFAANFLHKLTASSSMSLTHEQFVQDAVTELLSSVIDKVKQSTASLLCKTSCNSTDMRLYMNELDTLRNPFEGIDSVYKLQKYIGKSQSFVPANEHVLGQHLDVVCQQDQQELKNDTFMYVSVEATLRHVLRWNKTWEAMYNIEDLWRTMMVK